MVISEWSQNGLRSRVELSKICTQRRFTEATHEGSQLARRPGPGAVAPQRLGSRVNAHLSQRPSLKHAHILRLGAFSCSGSLGRSRGVCLDKVSQPRAHAA